MLRRLWCGSLKKESTWKCVSFTDTFLVMVSNSSLQFSFVCYNTSKIKTGEIGLNNICKDELNMPRTDTCSLVVGNA